MAINVDLFRRSRKHRQVIITAVIITFCLLTFAYGPAYSADAKEIELKTEIASATIYSREAQVLRRGEVEVEPGHYRIVCEDLPKKFIESSLLVEGKGNARARIIGIDLSRREEAAVSPEGYEELKTELNKLRGEYHNLEIKRESLKRRKELMTSIKDFSLQKAHDQLARKIFSVEDWKLLLDFYQNEHTGTEGKIWALNSKLSALRKKIEWTKNEIRSMRFEDKSSLAVVIDCEVESAGTLTIDLAYLVPDAFWTPEYTIRYLKPESEIALTYNARISQATGEDWKDVSVLLSTAKPHIGASPPTLVPLLLGVARQTGTVRGRITDERTGKSLSRVNVVIVGSRMGGVTMKDGTYRITGVPVGTYTVKAMMMGYASNNRPYITINPGRDAVANFTLRGTRVGKTREIIVEEDLAGIETRESSAHDYLGGEALHVRGGRSDDEALEIPPLPELVPFEEAEVSTTEFAANLQIKKSVDLETGSEPKRSLVVRETFPGAFSLYTVPSLSEHVYVEGTFENTLDLPLLSGMSEVYIETRPAGATNRVSNFVGKEMINPVASGQEFTVHLGIDQNIKVEYKLEKKEYLSKPGKKYKKIRYHYLITLESFKKETVVVRLEDRIPVSTMKAIKVVDEEIEPMPDKREDDGIISWMLQLVPGEKAEVKVAYTIMFPGDWSESYVMFKE